MLGRVAEAGLAMPFQLRMLAGDNQIDMKTEQEDSGLREAVGATPALTATAGDLALAVALIAEGVVTRAVINPLLQRLHAERAAVVKEGQTRTRVQLLVNEQIAKLDDLLAIIVERSGLPYLPLSIYDIDRDVACLLPREIAFEFCLIPFDQISRSVLVAVANPLDTAIRDRIRTRIGYDLFLYVSSPVEITSALRRAHGLDKEADGGRAKA